MFPNAEVEQYTFLANHVVAKLFLSGRRGGIAQLAAMGNKPVCSNEKCDSRVAKRFIWAAMKGSDLL